MSEVLAAAGGDAVQVRTPHVTQLTPLLEAEGATVTGTEPDTVSVTGLDAPRIAAVAAAGGIVVYGLTPVTRSLEDAYIALTRDDVEYRTGRTSAEANR